MNVNNNAIKRIMADVRELAKHPSPRYSAAPLEDNVFEWHFSIRGPKGSDFEGGTYHGRILLPSEYPFKPPNIIFLTKTGRFEIGTKICLSISAYHEESWQPAWGVRTMLEAIISFLPSEGAGSIGSLEYSTKERQKLAKESISYVCPCCGPIANLLSDIDEKEEPDADVASQVSQLRMAGSAIPGVKSPSPLTTTASQDQIADTAENEDGKVSGDCDVSATMSVHSAADAVQTGTATAVSDISNTAQASHEKHSEGFGSLYNNSDIDGFVKNMLVEACKGDLTDAEPSSTTDTNMDTSSAKGFSRGDKESVSSAPSSSSHAAAISTSNLLQQSGDVAHKPLSPPPLNDGDKEEKVESIKNGQESPSTTLADADVVEMKSAIVQQPGRDITDRVLEFLLYVIGAAICYIVLRRAILIGIQRSNEDLDL